MLGAGQIAIRAPPTTIRPPIQIHITSGEAIRWNWAWGGLFMYAAASACRRPKLHVVDVAIQGLVQSVDKFRHAANLPPTFFRIA